MDTGDSFAVSGSPTAPLKARMSTLSRVAKDEADQRKRKNGIHPGLEEAQGNLGFLFERVQLWSGLGQCSGIWL